MVLWLCTKNTWQHNGEFKSLSLRKAKWRRPQADGISGSYYPATNFINRAVEKLGYSCFFVPLQNNEE